MTFNTLNISLDISKYLNISFRIGKPVYNTVLYSHCPRFLMERGCNIHVFEYFDKLPRKNISLSKKQSLLWSALPYGQSNYMHLQRKFIKIITCTICI